MRLLSAFSKLAAAAAAMLFLALAAGLLFAQQVRKAVDPTNTVSVTVVSSMSESKPIPISATAGSDINITLPANPTTGFQWRLANKPNAAVVKFVRSTYTQPGSDGRVGRAGVETWIFQAVKRGTATIALDYVRPWEKNVKPAKKQSFSVRVQ